ncbi:MAG: MotA/TolQ/ExbB proton channel family protein [Odoribacter sp.]
MNNLILPAATTTTTIDTGMSLWDMVVKGGWLMIPIFILSVIAVYVFIERYIQIRKCSRLDRSFIDQISTCLHKGDPLAAIAICKKVDSPMSRMLIKGILHRRLPANEIREMIENSANLEVSALEKGLTTLATCSGMAPMIGFLGTVVGMVQAFYDMALAGNNINITLLSRGIYTAMITTVAGLMVGIPAYLAYNVLTARIDAVVNQMNSISSDFMEIIYEETAEK